MLNAKHLNTSKTAIMDVSWSRKAYSCCGCVLCANVTELAAKQSAAHPHHR